MKTAADLRDRVTVQAPTKVRDAAGQPIPGWADEATVWGLYEPTGGTEVEGAGMQARATVTGRVWLRRRDGLTAEKRLVVSGYGLAAVTLNIAAVMRPDPETGLMILLVREPDTVREAT